MGKSVQELNLDLEQLRLRFHEIDPAFDGQKKRSSLLDEMMDILHEMGRQVYPGWDEKHVKDMEEFLAIPQEDRCDYLERKIVELEASMLTLQRK